MSRPLGDRENTFKAYNQTGADINNARLVHCNDWVATANVPSIRYATGDGTSNLADGILISPAKSPQALANGRTGRVYTEYVLEDVNTAGTAVNDNVYLDSATGLWTFTRPTTAGRDVQVVGRVLTVSATAGRIGFFFTPFTNSNFGAGSISSLMLEDKPYHFPGHAAQGWIRISNAVADGDRISINGRIYEFDTAAPPGAIGAGANVRVGVSGAGGDQANTPAGCEAALADAINSDASAVVWATAMGGAGFVALVAKVVGTAGNYAIVDTVDTGNVITLSAATLVGGAAEAPQTKVERAYVITAADVVALAATLGTSEVPIMTFPSSTTATLFGVSARSAAGRSIDLDGATFTLRTTGTGGGGFQVLCMAENAGGALLAAGDIVIADIQLAD